MVEYSHLNVWECVVVQFHVDSYDCIILVMSGVVILGKGVRFSPLVSGLWSNLVMTGGLEPSSPGSNPGSPIEARSKMAMPCPYMAEITGSNPVGPI